jgi:hypothetical protein
MTAIAAVKEISSDFNSIGELPKRSLFLAHASYEPRSTAIASRDLRQLGVTRAFIIASSASLKKLAAYQESERVITRRMEEVGAVVNTLSFDRDRLLDYLEKLDAEIKECFGHSGFDAMIVDSTTFPKDRLWLTIDYLKISRPDIRLIVLYVEPDAYNTELVPEGAGWLSAGVKRVSAVPRFNGYQHSDRPTLLTVVVGHEKERMQITVRNIEPQKLVLIEQGAQQHGETSPVLPSQLAAYIGADFAHVIDLEKRYSAGSRDHLAVYQAITDIRNRFGQNYNIIVSANGTKLQSIGALMACRKHRDLAAVYTEPQVYNNESYSKGTGATWVLEI